MNFRQEVVPRRRIVQTGLTLVGYVMPREPATPSNRTFPPLSPRGRGVGGEGAPVAQFYKTGKIGSVLLRHSKADVNGRKQHKDIGLQQGDKDMQGCKKDGHEDRDES